MNFENKIVTDMIYKLKLIMPMKSRIKKLYRT